MLTILSRAAYQHTVNPRVDQESPVSGTTNVERADRSTIQQRTRVRVPQEPSSHCHRDRGLIRATQNTAYPNETHWATSVAEVTPTSVRGAWEWFRN